MNKQLIKIGFAVLATILLMACQSNCNINNKCFFKIQNGQLLDAKGNNFIMRGVNVPHAWHGQKSYEALDEIANERVNCVRIVWQSNLPANGLDSIIQKCINLKMIPMVELHDATGDSTEAKLLELAAYFTTHEMKRIYDKYEKYLLINIANEWGNHSVTNEYWRDAYKKCITLLRQAGYHSTIVIDAPGWGQNAEPILTYGNELFAFDPQQNLLFSIHMYGSWNEAEKIKSHLTEATDKKLPLIVGEFGYNYNKGNNNLTCRVNHQQILKTCDELQLGYLAWSWTGNNTENKWLDLVSYDDWQTLTWWGKEVFDSPYGIKKTSVIASVFE